MRHCDVERHDNRLALRVCREFGRCDIGLEILLLHGGVDEDSRALASAVALLAFLSKGHTATEGAFRSHVAKLVKFLESLTRLASKHQRIVSAVVELAKKGAVPAGDWVNLGGPPGDYSGGKWKRRLQRPKPGRSAHMRDDVQLGKLSQYCKCRLQRLWPRFQVT